MARTRVKRPEPFPVRGSEGQSISLDITGEHQAASGGQDRGHHGILAVVLPPDLPRLYIERLQHAIGPLAKRAAFSTVVYGSPSRLHLHFRHALAHVTRRDIHLPASRVIGHVVPALGPRSAGAD